MLVGRCAVSTICAMNYAPFKEEIMQFCSCPLNSHYKEMQSGNNSKLNTFSIGIPNVCRASIFLSFYGFEPKIILKLFLNVKGVILSEIERNVFKYLL